MARTATVFSRTRTAPGSLFIGGLIMLASFVMLAVSQPLPRMSPRSASSAKYHNKLIMHSHDDNLSTATIVETRS